MTTAQVPVIVAASMLSLYDSPMLPIVRDMTEPGGIEKKGGKFFQAIGGLPIIRMLVETKPSDYYAALWRPCTTIGIWIGSVNFDDSLEKLFHTFEATGFGDARVEAATPPNALITLTEVLSLYREMKLKCNLKVKDVASEAILVDPGTKLIEAMRIMCEKRVRRLFLRGRAGEFVADRNIMAFLLSPKSLRLARDSPRFWTDSSISAIHSMKARTVPPDALVEEVGRISEEGRDVFVLPGEASLLSRWDLVMKPWKAGKLSLSF